MRIITLLRGYSSGILRSDALVRRYSEDGVWVSKISKISPLWDIYVALKYSKETEI